MTLIVIFNDNTFAQSKIIPKTSLDNLPYIKNKKQDYLSLNLSGGVALETDNFNNTYLISLTPRFNNYLNSRWEMVSDYTFIFQKLGRLAGKEKIIYHQVSSSMRFFPSKKINIFYLESGVQFGNYALKRDNMDDLIAIKKWHPDWLVGIGLELLPKKRKYIFDFEVRYVFPFNGSLENDIIRSLGFGTKITF